MPVGDVLVCDPGRDVEHDDATLTCRARLETVVTDIGKDTLNIVSISQAPELLLSSCIPGIKADLAKVGMKCDRVD